MKAVSNIPIFANYAPTAMPKFAPGQYWTRAKYDQEYQNIDLKQSTRPLEFSLDPNYSERCDRCLATEVGWLGKQGVSYDANRPMVDTESDLWNIGRPLSKDVHRYHPTCVKGDCIGVMNDCDQCQPALSHFPVCGRKMNYEATRLSNPPFTLKETGVNRFQPICLDPQDRTRWEHPGEVGINYRMVVKDNHVPCMPRPMDQTLSLPKGGDLPCEKIFPTCSAPIVALNNYQRQSEAMAQHLYK